MKLTSPIKLNIAKKLKEDKAYRKRFLRRRTQDEIAMNIRSLREKRQMRQVDLASKSNMKQSAISRIEQAEYASWSLTTLFRVAGALSARVRVIFEPVEDVIEKYNEKEKEITSESHLEQYVTTHLSNALIDKIPVRDSLPTSNQFPHLNRNIPTVRA